MRAKRWVLAAVSVAAMWSADALAIGGLATPDGSGAIRATRMIVARGALENALYVVPSLDLVVARTAVPVRRPPGAPSFDREFWRLLRS